jgi:hypothetical protein
MNTTYRCAYLDHGTESTVLTGPEHAELSDDDLRAEALAEGYRADIIGAAPPRLTLAQFLALLTITD